MKTAATLLLVGLLPVVSLAQATAPSTTAPSADAGEIEALVKQLSADSFQARQEAQDRLVRYGADARPLLQKLLETSTDPEARTRAEAAMSQIEEDRVTGPSMVTMHVKDGSPERALAELSRQGMYAIPTMPENLFQQEHMNVPTKVTLDVDRQPFWVAMRQYCEKTGLRVNAMGGERKFVITMGGDESLLGPVVYSGPFMVVANSVTRTSSINLAHDRAPARSLNLQITVFAEPKLNVMGHDYYPRLTEAVDDRGNSLLVPRQVMYSSMSQDVSMRWTLGAPLSIPENLGTRLVRLKGFCRVMMQTRSETWEVPNALTAGGATQSKAIGGRRYVVNELKAVGNGDAYQLKLTVVREGARGEMWQQFGRGMRVSLVDGDGKALANRGWGQEGPEEKATYTYTFSRGTDTGGQTGAAAKLVLEVPTEVKEVEVPFEFKDLPLP